MISRPCHRAGCAASALPGTTTCAGHATHARAALVHRQAALDAARGTAHARGYTGKWSAYAATLRRRYPLSPGYLTPSEYWTKPYAEQFDALRQLAAGQGRYLTLMTAVAEAWTPDNPRTLRPPAILDPLAPLPPIPAIYYFHPAAHPESTEEVDHIKPVAGPGDPLFWAQWNHQALSKRQHSEKTATHDGGFRGSRNIAVSQPGQPQSNT